MKHTNQERKVYPMKFTKFIPVALALTMVAPAFAAEDAAKLSEQSLMSITVPHYVYISKEDETASVNATFNSTYDEIYLSDNLNVKFKVLTNKASNDTVQFTATCNAGGVQVTALGGTKDAMILAFTKNDGSATAAAVTNALGDGSAKGSNPNTIAFAMTPTPGKDASSGATDVTVYSMDAGVVTYTMPTAGVYTWNYEVGDEAKANTFSTHDTYGTYQATLTMTHAALDS